METVEAIVFANLEPVETAISTETIETEPALPISAWSPLASPLFRLFWIASLTSNVGTWIHEVGAGWLMSSLNDSPQMVSAVRVAMSLPILLLALPAGALADRVDRKQLLLVMQCLLMATTAALALLTYTQTITPTWLLVLTVLMAFWLVIHVPTWQASIPELVPHEQIPQAVALGSISFNLARSVGPALGGVLIAMFGTWIAFALNGLSFGMVIIALLCWRRVPNNFPIQETYLQSIRSGLLFVTGQRVIRHTLFRVFLFGVPASALWSMLPLVAREQLHWDSSGYGYLVGAVGLGAVFGAAWLPRVRRLVGVDQTVFLGMCIFAVGLAVTSISTNRLLTLTMMCLMGLGWMVVLTTLNSTVQVAVTNHIRARSMACYLSALAGAMALGAWLWGVIAREYSPAYAELFAAALLPIHAIAGLFLPIRAQRTEA